MTVNPRVTFLLDPRPLLVWKEVPDVSSYKFKLVNKETSEPLWEIKVTSWQSDGNYCNFDYPECESPLEPLVHYVLTGETDETPSKTASDEIIVLEEAIEEKVKTFASRLETLVEATPSITADKLTEQFAEVVSNLLSGDAQGGRCPKTNPNCMSLSFEPDEI